MRLNARTQPRRRRTERGSATVEAVLGIPVFTLLILLAAMGGRVMLASQAVNGAAADAARAASIARNAHQGDADARNAAHSSLEAQQITCLRTTVTVNTTGLTRPAGTPGEVSVTVTCVLQLADLGLPGAPSSKVITATVTSPVDTYRQRGVR